ncbi:hypothetical protein BCR33DRAFT_771194 [Rhizoclosmatium globosum]|uniref:PH domain-containing protein n=1 Tax=Rhizoclosmatium globosum TaxID=329046 RepID=A0A1Y2BEC5_9FUNG|nr:hypothetical protein BCR33DRAFT_771194 [Rhizoclosmatium globosum]|eukprot:ORY33188.1 hypothetical protein BCR33DRAFT_771194 [Rhizoclosmatium globosum]
MSVPLSHRSNSSTGSSHSSSFSSSLSKSANKLDTLMASLSEFSVRDSLVPSASAVSPVSPGFEALSMAPRKGSDSSRRSVESAATTTSTLGLRRSKSARGAWTGVDGDVLEALTLGKLVRSGETLSAFLFKMNANLSDATGPSDIWKLRFFVLDQEATLYLFKNNTNPRALPITSMPVTSCSAEYDPHENAWVLTALGDGISPDGKLVKRFWKIKLPDQGSTVLWLEVIQRGIAMRNADATMTSQLQSQSHAAMPIAAVMSATSPYHNHPAAYQSVPYQQPQLDPYRIRSGSLAETSAIRTSFSLLNIHHPQPAQQDPYMMQQRLQQERYLQEQVERMAMMDQVQRESRKQEFQIMTEKAMMKKQLDDEKHAKEAKEKAEKMKALMGL